MDVQHVADGGLQINGAVAVWGYRVPKLVLGTVGDIKAKGRYDLYSRGRHSSGDNKEDTDWT